MDYVESLEIYGVEAKEIPCIVGNGTPIENAPIGCLYLNETNGKIYKRVKKDENSLEWVGFESGEINLRPGAPNQVLTTNLLNEIVWADRIVDILIGTGIPTENAEVGKLYFNIETSELYKRTNSDGWQKIHESFCTKYYIQQEVDTKYYLYKLTETNILEKVNCEDLYNKLQPLNNRLVEIYLKILDNHYVDGYEIGFSNDGMIFINFKSDIQQPMFFQAQINDLKSSVVTVKSKALLQEIEVPSNSNYFLVSKIENAEFPTSEWKDFGLNSATEGQIPVKGENGIEWKDIAIPENTSTGTIVGEGKPSIDIGEIGSLYLDKNSSVLYKKIEKCLAEKMDDGTYQYDITEVWRPIDVIQQKKIIVSGTAGTLSMVVDEKNTNEGNPGPFQWILLDCSNKEEDKLYLDDFLQSSHFHNNINFDFYLKISGNGIIPGGMVKADHYDMRYNSNSSKGQRILKLYFNDYINARKLIYKYEEKMDDNGESTNIFEQDLEIIYLPSEYFLIKDENSSELKIYRKNELLTAPYSISLKDLTNDLTKKNFNSYSQIKFNYSFIDEDSNKNNIKTLTNSEILISYDKNTDEKTLTSLKIFFKDEDLKKNYIYTYNKDNETLDLTEEYYYPSEPGKILVTDGNGGVTWKTWDEIASQ